MTKTERQNWLERLRQALEILYGEGACLLVGPFENQALKENPLEYPPCCNEHVGDAYIFEMQVTPPTKREEREIFFRNIFDTVNQLSRCASQSTPQPDHILHGAFNLFPPKLLRMTLTLPHLSEEPSKTMLPGESQNRLG